jgi:DNA polymerase III epsilon subunit family exonuclease
MSALEEKEFIIFDVETTGLSPSFGDRIVEIAALKVKGLKPVERFHSLVNPGRPISLAAFEVNRISDQMVAKAPCIHDVLPSFLTFIGQTTLVGHNIRFDLGFLYHELEIAGLSLGHAVESLDTIQIARRVLPDLRRYPLWLVADTLGIKENQKHRAMADVELTFEVFCRLLRMASEKNILEEFLA